MKEKQESLKPPLKKHCVWFFFRSLQRKVLNVKFWGSFTIFTKYNVWMSCTFSSSCLVCYDNALLNFNNCWENKNAPQLYFLLNLLKIRDPFAPILKTQLKFNVLYSFCVDSCSPPEISPAVLTKTPCFCSHLGCEVLNSFSLWWNNGVSFEGKEHFLEAKAGNPDGLRGFIFHKKKKKCFCSMHVLLKFT